MATIPTFQVDSEFRHSRMGAGRRYRNKRTGMGYVVICWHDGTWDIIHESRQAAHILTAEQERELLARTLWPAA